MAAPKRDKFQREYDYERIISYYLKGWRQVDIAAELGLSQQQVSKDLASIQRRWRSDTAINLDEAKSKEIARIDELEREYWAAWESSKSERTKARQESSGKVDPLTKKAVADKAVMEREQRDGNPAFLAGVLSCIDRRCKLLGLDAPEKREHTGKDGGPIEQVVKHDNDLSKLSIDELKSLQSIVLKMSDEPTDD